MIQQQLELIGSWSYKSLYLPKKIHPIKTLTLATYLKFTLRRYDDRVGCRTGYHLLQYFQKLHNPNTIQCGARWALSVLLKYGHVPFSPSYFGAAWCSMRLPVNTVSGEIYVCVLLVTMISSRNGLNARSHRVINCYVCTFTDHEAYRVFPSLASQTHRMHNTCAILDTVNEKMIQIGRTEFWVLRLRVRSLLGSYFMPRRSRCPSRGLCRA